MSQPNHNPVQDFIVTEMAMGEITPYIRRSPDFVSDTQAATKRR